jgi:lactate racemase
LGEWTTFDKVAVAIPDHTRTIEVSKVLDQLQNNLKGEKTVIVGLGLHREMTFQELASIAHHKPIQHNPNDCQEIVLPDGELVALNSNLVQADWSISIGVSELHQYAGVSGGYKGVVVGCGSASIISQLHHRDSVCAQGVSIGTVKGNPFRQRIERIGQASNCIVALVYVPSIEQWLFGYPSAVIERAAQLIDPWVWIDKPAKGAILRVPKSKARTFYQASRAATYLALSPNPAVQNGGRLILDASLDEGVGSEEGFVSALSRFNPPWQEVLEGGDVSGAGSQRIIMLALAAKRYTLQIRGCSNPELFLKLGIDASSERPKVLDGWLDVTDPFVQIPQWRA